MSARASAVVVLVVVLIFASWTRLAKLGDSELWIDEYYHYFAAEGIARGAGPVLPSGERYARGLTTTRLAGIARRHVDDAVAATRLPSAIFGIAGVLIIAAIGWRLGGPWTAIWSALLLATYPGAVSQARNARFYTEQLAVALIALWMGWLALRSPPDRERMPSLPSQWAPIAGASVAFAFGVTIQPTTYSVAGAFAVALALMALWDLRILGRLAWTRSARVQATALGALAVVLVVSLAGETVRAMAMAALDAPLWAEGRFSPLAYYWTLSQWEPLLIGLAPVVFIIVAVRDARLALYLALWFAVPLALHSFVFRFQSERYILAAVPGLLLAGAVALERLAAIGYAALRRSLEARSVPLLRARAMAAIAIAVAALTFVVTSPGFTFARKSATGAITRTRTNWNGVADVLRRVPGSDTIPWGSRDPLASLAGWGRVDFTIYRGYLERPPLPGDARVGPVLYEDGVADYYSGVPVLTTPDAIRAHYSSKGAALVVVDSAYDADVRSELMTTLRRQAAELCQGTCGPMRVYLWRFADEEARTR